MRVVGVRHRDGATAMGSTLDRSGDDGRRTNTRMHEHDKQAYIIMFK
jgi:hypothetical protein